MAQTQEKKYVIKESALQLLLESVNIAHSGVTNELVHSFVKSSVEDYVEPKIKKLKEDEAE